MSLGEVVAVSFRAILGTNLQGPKVLQVRITKYTAYTTSYRLASQPPHHNSCSSLEKTRQDSWKKHVSTQSFATQISVFNPVAPNGESQAVHKAGDRWPDWSHQEPQRSVSSFNSWSSAATRGKPQTGCSHTKSSCHSVQRRF